MNLQKNASAVLQSCLGVQAGETVLVVTDDSRLAIGQALYQAARELGCESLLMVMGERDVSGQEPPPAVAAAMLQADVVVCPTAKSLTHTHAKLRAKAAGVRVATMPGITEEMFHQGAMTADYAQVEQLTMRLVALLDTAQTARIEKGGRSLTMSLAGRDGVPSTGVYRERGQCGNLPSGEAYIAPLETESHGTMIIDGSMVGVGVLEEPLIVRVEQGKLVEIQGPDSHKLGVLLENERNATLCELGIGTNEAAILSGVILEDEKVYGTVHIAFGTNDTFGGINKADCHMDGIILEPDLYLDDQPILKAGKFVL